MGGTLEKLGTCERRWCMAPKGTQPQGFSATWRGNFTPAVNLETRRSRIGSTNIHTPIQRAYGTPYPGILPLLEKVTSSTPRLTEPGFPVLNRQYKPTVLVG